MSRNILRWFASKAKNVFVSWIGGTMISFVSQLIEKESSDQLLPIVISSAVIGLVCIIAGKLLSVFLFWVSRRFNYLHVHIINENSRLLSLNITNGYTENIEDFKVSLKKVVVFGFQEEFIVPNENEFTETRNISNRKVTPKQDNAKVLIARLHPENQSYVDILVKGGFLNDAAYKFDGFNSAVYEIVFEITGRVQDENISRWYRARFRYDEQEKGVVKPIRSIEWMTKENYSKRKYEKYSDDFSNFSSELIPALYEFGKR